MTDLRIIDEGTIVLLEPATAAGKAWLDEHVEAGMTWGRCVVCEPRYVEDLVAGARGDGLVVE